MRASKTTMMVLAAALLVTVGIWGTYRGGEALAQLPPKEKPLGERVPLFPSEDFTCYVINQGTAPQETVTLTDQFGERQVVVRQPQLLCAPTLKERNGKEMEKKGDSEPDLNGPHLKCYNITPAGPPVGETHTLSDQFEEKDNVMVQTAQLLCTLACKDQDPTGDDQRACVKFGTREAETVKESTLTQ
jgi:hypothetical protein